MTEVVKISKQGKDVLTESSINNFIFDSTVNTFKILATGTAGGTVTANPTTFTVAHSQAGVPAFFAFARFPDGYIALPNQTDHAFTSTGGRQWFAEVDGTNLYFLFFKGASANYSGTVKYYVFEPAI